MSIKGEQMIRPSLFWLPSLSMWLTGREPKPSAKGGKK